MLKIEKDGDDSLSIEHQYLPPNLLISIIIIIIIIIIIMVN